MLSGTLYSDGQLQYNVINTKIEEVWNSRTAPDLNLGLRMGGEGLSVSLTSKPKSEGKERQKEWSYTIWYV